jgi:hypothetical protein
VIDPFFNVNTPEDLLEAQGLWQQDDLGENS